MGDILLFQIFEGLSVVFETFIIYQYINGLFLKRTSKRGCFLWYVVFCLILTLLSLLIREPIFLIAYILTGLYVLEVFLYKSNVSSRVFSILYFAAITIVSEFLCSALISELWSLEITETLDYGLSRVLGILVAKLIQIFIVKLSVTFARWKREDFIGVELKMVFPLLICQLCSIVLAYHVFVLCYNIYEEFHFTAFLSMAGIVYMNVIIFWYFDRIKAVYSYKAKNEAMEIKLELQNEYYITLAEHQKETDALWHDMKKHINLMKSLVNSGQSDISAKYLDELEADMSKRIRIVQTEQSIIGALLTEQFKRADRETVLLDLDARLESEMTMKIGSVDLCVILGNLFDNAFEACSALTQGCEKYIKAEIKQREQSLYIRIENPNPPEHSTSKRVGKHGFGLNNVRKAVRKYNGQISINTMSDEFAVSIIIP